MPSLHTEHRRAGRTRLGGLITEESPAFLQHSLCTCTSRCGLHNKVSQSDRLKQEKYIFSLSQRPKGYQGVGRVAFFRGRSPWLGDGHPLCISSRGLLSEHVYVHISSSYKDLSHIGFCPTLMTSLNSIPSLMTLSAIESFSEVLGIKTSTN